MPLSQLTQIKGYEASYWRILGASFNVQHRHAVIRAGLYKDEAAYRESPDNALKYEDIRVEVDRPNNKIIRQLAQSLLLADENSGLSKATPIADKEGE